MPEDRDITPEGGKILYWHEEFLKIKLPIIRNLKKEADESISPHKQIVLGIMVNSAYRRYFEYFIARTDPNIEEIIALKLPEGIVLYTISRPLNQKGQAVFVSAEFSSLPLKELVQLICPEEFLESEGLCVRLDELETW